MSYSFFYDLVDNITTVPIVDYVESINNIEMLAVNTFNKLEDQDFNSFNKEKLFNEIKKLLVKRPELPLIEIVDISGKVIISTDPYETNKYINIGDVIDKVNSQNKAEFDENDYTVMKTLKYDGKLAYYIYSEVPEGKIIKISNSDSFIPLILSFLVSIALFFYLTNKKMKYLLKITEGIEYISSGDLEYKIPVHGKDELAKLARRVNLMSKNLKQKIELERKAENTKNELITNISHDLKTPLTSVIGYITLIKDKKYTTSEEFDEYVDIVYNKSERLKKLIADLFDFTKLSNVGFKLELEKISIFELVDQIVEEYKDLFEKQELKLKVTVEDIKKEIYADPVKIVRMFDNLISNALKYSNPNSLVEICAKDSEENFIFYVINDSLNMDEDKTNKIFDRFYKVDESRNSSNQGSGLGLAITKSIVKLHNGEIKAFYNDGKIKVMIKLPY
ncbi:HAMP domain-containing sensor histidine kinase [Helicovermis profundi]|uniref:histidine kinase n=1 Tax=Helicovermis profundi TaxID=3065157 RepID=A0AAU9E218_9FIRM|nr:HAMP domain-containing sensor histidine kinase [Clostridia bacterium S502]